MKRALAMVVLGWLPVIMAALVLIAVSVCYVAFGGRTWAQAGVMCAGGAALLALAALFGWLAFCADEWAKREWAKRELGKGRQS